MANEAPDLSRIVNLILSNPKLIEEISALVKSDGTGGAPDTEPTAVVGASALPPDGAAEVSAHVQGEEPVGAAESTASDTAVPTAAGVKLHRETRSHLLSALKPYLSDNRRKAVDSMLQIADLLDVFKTVR